MRIASLSPAVTEILFKLGQGKNVVCVDQFSDVPSEVSGIPHLKDHQKVKTDDIRAFTPDLVFTSALVQEKLAEKLKKDGLGVVHQDPRSTSEMYASIREIGQLLDCSARAETLIAEMQHGFSQVKKKTGFFRSRPKVYVEEWHEPPMVSGNWVPEVVKIAGGIPMALGERAPSREVSLEEVRAFDPDLIVLSASGASKDLLTSRAGWAELRAVTENHLFVIDDALLSRPGPRLTEGASRLFGWIFQTAH